MCQNYFPFEQLSALVYTAMGRGRNNGPVDQSTKKPKVGKNKERGGVNWTLFKPHSIGEKKELPILVSEELLAEMKKMSTQELMNNLLPDNENNVSSKSEKKQLPTYRGNTNITARIKGKNLQALSYH